VLTIHDISYERNPEWYPYRRDWLRRAFYRWSARAADHVLTCSGFSASEIAEMYALPVTASRSCRWGVGEFSPVERTAG
jgi:hypothetical protein